MKLEKLNASLAKSQGVEIPDNVPVKVIQFGEGNFLRAFVDWIVESMNEKTAFNSQVAVVQPINAGLIDLLNQQDSLYTLFLKGLKEGEAVREKYLIKSLAKGINPYQDFSSFLELAHSPELQFVLSNTTEAGISTEADDTPDMKPPQSFPAKLAVFLYERYQHFNGDPEKGVALLPCELIDENGKALKKAVIHYARKWQWEENFFDWLDRANHFCSTLVDRIVPGFPRDTIEEVWQELGYQDQLVVEGEYFHLWVIEAPDEVREAFPADKAGLNVLFVDDLKPYKVRKVRILNGAHTSMVPVAYLYGIDTVKEAVEDEVVGKFVQQAIYEEIIPTLTLPKDELEAFAGQVLERFRNPYIKHYLLSISLNSMSKFRTRVLPSLLEYQESKVMLPPLLTFSLATLLYFYKGDRSGQPIELKDNEDIIDLFQKVWGSYEPTPEGAKKVVEEVLAYEVNWGLDLNQIPTLTNTVSEWLWMIDQEGIGAALKKVLGEKK